MTTRSLSRTIMGLSTYRPFLRSDLTYSRIRYVGSSSSERDIKFEEPPDQGSDIGGVPLDPFARISGGQESYVSDINPPMKRAFNLASYVNSSETLRELIKIGVSLYDIENQRPDAAQLLVQLDFQKDCVKYLKLLVDSGLKTSNLGRFLTEFPEIFQVPILELQTRLEYLRSKNFSTKQIARALNRSSYIVSQKVKSTDFKLGQLQVEFSLPAPIIRTMVSKYPPVIAHPVNQYRLINICLSDEFGFNLKQVHSILEQQPKTLDIMRPRLIDKLDLIHNSMGLSHAMITQFPKLITGPDLEIKQRFLYLKKLKRDQFNPKLPLYVQPSALYNSSDEKFCEQHAKTDLNDYKLFVKTCL